MSSHKAQFRPSARALFSRPTMNLDWNLKRHLTSLFISPRNPLSFFTRSLLSNGGLSSSTFRAAHNKDSLFMRCTYACILQLFSCYLLYCVLWGDYICAVLYGPCKPSRCRYKRETCSKKKKLIQTKLYQKQYWHWIKLKSFYPVRDALPLFVLQFNIYGWLNII